MEALTTRSIWRADRRSPLAFTKTGNGLSNLGVDNALAGFTAKTPRLNAVAAQRLDGGDLAGHGTRLQPPLRPTSCKNKRCGCLAKAAETVSNIITATIKNVLSY